MCGVADVYLYCGAHNTQVEDYVKQSKWYPSPGTSTVPSMPSMTFNASASPFRSLEVINITGAHSVGDVLRALDQRDIITGDFLLVYGDLISNFPIDDALAAHRARRIVDKNSIMTVVLRSAGIRPHRTKSQSISPVFVIDPAKNRCLQYEEMKPKQANKYVYIDPELVSKKCQIEVGTDLIDCGIDICTPDVLALWSDGFDYNFPRRDFLHGVLKDYDLNGKTIHTEIVKDHYAARVSNPLLYEAISKDVLGRWTYPFGPYSNLVAGQTFKYERGGLCKENGVALARTCKVGKRTVLGKDTSIGEGTTVTNSIIGRRCQIGKNVTIQNSCIWDDVVVSDGSTVVRATIANEAVVGRDCTIQPRALLSYGVRIGDSIEVKAGVRITRAKRKPQDDEGEPQVVLPETAIVGDVGEGYQFESDEASDGEASDDDSGTESISTFTSDLSTSSLKEPRSRTTSFTGSLVSEDGDSPGSNETFHHEAVSGIYDALKQSGDLYSAKLEFMALRFSNDASDHQMRRAIAAAFAKRISQLLAENERMKEAAAATEVLKLPGAKKILSEVAIGTEMKKEDQTDFISCLQKDLVHRAKGQPILAAMCFKLYTMDLLEGGAILQWWQDCEALGDDEDKEMKRVREGNGMKAIIAELEKDSESEEEDESSEEESD
jgi:translation initiation factor eIF-2B subunit epsilon